jgi:hypothetical protein
VIEISIEVYLNGVFWGSIRNYKELNSLDCEGNLIIYDHKYDEESQVEKLFFITDDYSPPKEVYHFVSQKRDMTKGEATKMIDFTELPEDGVSFEQLIREMFIREGYDVHWTGVGPDGGRDLVVIEKVKGPLSYFERKWLIQCKHKAHSGKSVGLNELDGIVDACRAIGAEGFLLACSTQPSASLVKRLEELNQTMGIVTAFWDSIEIEKRLFQPNSFPLIHIFFPKTSTKVGWKIYNSNSPSFWAANFKDYFIYLSSRGAITFPNLKDVEAILNIIENFPKLPEKQFLRPRAVWFDNKHEQFTVYVDYMVPNDAEFILKPTQMNEYFQDGQGLYSDGDIMWYLTYWDIQLVRYNFYSDHYHKDHKDFYDPYIEKFKVGSYRSESLGDKCYNFDHW